MPNIPHLFGWGGYRRSSNTIFEMAYESMKLTLDVCRVAAEEIGLVIICSSDFNPVIEKQSYSELLISLGMNAAFPMGVTVSDCANLLSALNMARQLIVGKQYKNIMLVTSNKISDEQYRFQDYALFSDGAASFLISDRNELEYVPEDCFDIVDSQINARFEARKEDDEVDDSPLYITTANQIAERTDIAVSDLTKVFSNNLYLPVITLKEGSIGVNKSQLYLENVARFGHCFSADSVINLSDYMKTVGIQKGEYFALNSSAEGLRAQVLLQAYSGK
jgi:3-oxoacyl-[acyl-carrier-protein] synthase-3